VSRLKSLLKESLLYGVSSLVSRFLNFLLVPFYTHALSPADFGVSQIIFAIVAFCNILWQAGFDTAYLRLRHDEGDEAGGRRLFSTAFWALCLTSGLGTVLLAASTPWLGHLLVIPEGQRDLLRWAALILWLDALAVVPMAHLRFEHRALAFSLLRLFSVVVNIAGNVLFVWKGDFGLAGVFWANALASALMLLPLVPLALRHLRVTLAKAVDRERLMALLALGLPMVPAGLYGIVNDIAGRLSLGWLLTDADVAALYPGQGLTVLALTGLFAAAWKLGIFGLLLTQMYRLAWQPFFMQHGKDPDAPVLFGRILRLLLIGIGMSTGLVMLWLDKWVAFPIAGRSLIAREYWGGLGLVPIILLAYAFQAVFIHFTLGLYLAKRTRYLLTSNGIGAAVTVAGNWLLVPRIGPLGACLAAVLCYAVMAALVMRESQKLFRIELGGWRLGVLAAWLLAAHALGWHVQNFAEAWSNGMRLIATAAIWITPWMVGALTPQELRAAKALLRRGN
jgi:O-antigen/teichoic acid export membrane protein